MTIAKKVEMKKPHKEETIYCFCEKCWAYWEAWKYGLREPKS